MKHSLELKDFLDPKSGKFQKLQHEQQCLSRIMSTVYFEFAPIVPKYNLAKSTYESRCAWFIPKTGEAITSDFNSIFNNCLEVAWQKKETLIPLAYYWLMYLLSARPQDMDLLTMENVQVNKKSSA